MATSTTVPNTSASARKRGVRRRRQDKPPLAARLIIDDHLKTDVGILSEDLFTDLFPHIQEGQPNQGEQASPDTVHVAIAPWKPAHSPESTSWAIVPVTKSSSVARGTLQFSASSLSLQSFAANLQKVAPSRLASQSKKGIEILVLDVATIELDTVFVSLEGELAKRLESGEGTFFREHPAHPGKGKASTALSPQERLTAALRTALGTLRVVHSGDLFPLPLPPHPVTHVPPNPGKILLCEPVSQGVLSTRTKIIVSRGRVHSKHGRDSIPIQPNRNLNGLGEDEGDDATNDTFYSAAEERYKTDVPAETTDFTTETEESEIETHHQEEEDEDELSDDSMDEMISLQTPTLPPTITSGMSTMQPGSPMTVGRGRRFNGMSGPGSIFSSFTATTARPDRPRGRLFKAHGLLKALPSQLLHPPPATEDDEEARIYVDMRDLTRIGCFSGDWVRVEASSEPPSHGFGAFGLGSFVEQDPDEINWRPARVFGLPEGYSAPRSVTRIASSKHDGGRKMSFFESQIQKPSSHPAAYLSPILLANLDSPPYLRLSPVKKPSSSSHLSKSGLNPVKTTSTSANLRPPLAREVILQHVRTPSAVERDVQTAVMAGLKFYFEKRLRVVKNGDLIAVPIDTQLGKALQESSSTGLLGEDSAIDEVLGLISRAQDNKSIKYDEVAWFRVDHVQAVKSDSSSALDSDRDGLDGEQESEEDIWGGVACVDVSQAHLEQAGSTTSRIPGTTSSSWPYYLGIKKPPVSSAPVAGVPAPPTATLAFDPDRQSAKIAPLRRRLRELMAAATSKPALHLKMPPLAILLVSTQRNIGKATTAIQASSDIGLHTFTVDAYDIVNDAGGGGGSDVKTAGFLTSRAERAMSCGPESCVLMIRHIEALTADRMVASIKDILSETRVLIATTTEVEKVPDGIRALFTHELEMNAPDEGEREGILRSIVDERGLVLDPEVELSGIALKTAALVAGDLVDVVERAVVAQKSRLEALSAKATKGDKTVTVRDVQVAGGSAATGLTKADFEVAVEAARKNFADAIGAPKIPNVTWDDVGGLNNVKEAVTETIQLPLERPELFAKGMKKRSGILFYGPPGTGKTLLAKAIATEYSLNFFSVKGPELLNMYIGESEANVRRVFQRARDARPCAVFFDELDSVAPKRGNQGDSGGVMDRIVSQLLAELDGMSGGEDTGGGVFVIGATNRPDLLDPALLRPGRFDKMLYLGVSDTHEKQLTIMEALTRKFTLHPSVSLRAVAEKLPFTYTGADFYALCSDAMLKAVTRQAASVDAKLKALNSQLPAHKQLTTAAFFDHHATQEDIAVMVTKEDFMLAHQELIPSVSAGELAHYERVRAQFEGGRGEDKKKQVQGELPQQPWNGAPDGGRRSISGTSSTSRGKGKGKAASAPKDVKGKGKAIAYSDEEDNTDDVDDYGRSGMNGVDKGKGVAAASPFTNGSADDDEDLYT